MFNFSEAQIDLKSYIEDLIQKGLLTSDKPEDSYDCIQDILGKIHSNKLLGINLPIIYNGTDLDTVSQMLVLSSIAKENATVAHILGAHFYGFLQPIVDFYTANLNIDLTQLLQSGNFGTLAYTEPGGCNFDVMKLKAKKTDNGYLLNGCKAMITMANKANYILTFAKTNDFGNLFERFSMFIVKVSNQNGIRFGKNEKLMGLDGLPVSEINFSNTFLPKESLLGNEGDGIKILVKQLEKSRIANAAIAIGIAERAYIEALSFSNNRMLNGKLLNTNLVIKQKLSLMKIKLETIKLLTFQAARLCDIKAMELLNTSSIAKYQATQIAKEICDDALQIHGGSGYIKDSKIERLYRDIRIYTIIGGTSELIKSNLEL